MMAGRTLSLAAAGIGGGLAASLALSGALRGVLFGVSADDPHTYGTVAMGFVLLALAVGAVPTRRALQIDPVRAIRSE